MEQTIRGKQKYIGVVSALGLPLASDWIAIEADRPLSGFELFTRPNLMGGYTGVNITRQRGCFPRLETDGATGIAFVNVGDEPAQVVLNAYDDAGRSIADKTLDLEIHAKVVEQANNLFSPGDISTATHVMFESTGYIVGFQLNMTSDGMILEGLPGL